MTISAELESVSSQEGNGSVAEGIHREVITFSATGDRAGQGIGTVSYQLAADQSGALVIFNTAGGGLVTLPTPVAGMWFELVCQIATTASDVYKVITNSTTTEFLLGTVLSASATVAEGMDVFTADGTTNHDYISMNGTTSGGEVGTRLVFTAINSTQWFVKGVNQGSGGAVTDPFGGT